MQDKGKHSKCLAEDKPKDCMKPKTKAGTTILSVEKVDDKMVNEAVLGKPKAIRNA